MKILQVVHSFPPDMGGIENHVFNLCRELAKKNEVIVLTTRAAGSKEDEVVSGIRIKRYWCASAPWFSSVKFAPGLFLDLWGEDADVICSHGYGSLMPFFASLVSKIRKKTFVFTLHGYPRIKGIGGLMQKGYRFFIAPWFLSAAKRIISVTESSLNDIEAEIDLRKVEVIPNGVDVKRFVSKLDIMSLGVNRILYVGRLDRYKSIDTIIKAVALTERKDIVVRIVGDDEGEKKKLVILADRLGVKTEFSRSKYEEITREYENASMVVLPSKYEGLSLVLLEAISCERPTFSTPVGDAPRLFKEVYGNKARFFLFENEKELAGRIEEALKCKKELSLVASKARKKLIAKYSWKEVAARTFEVYKRAIRM